MVTVKSLSALAATVLLTAVGSAAQASTAVSYYTTGTFSGGVGFTFGSNATSVSATKTAASDPDTATLRYVFQNSLATPVAFDWGDLVAPTGPHVGYWSVADFGAFEVTRTGSVGSPGVLFTGLTFTLNIFQLVPGTGGGSLVGSISGSVTGSSGSSLQWAPVPSFFIPPPGSVLYSIAPPSGVVGISGTSSTTLKGEVELGPGFAPPEAPLPSVASMGMTMLGLVVLGLGSRKLASRVAVV